MSTTPTYYPRIDADYLTPLKALKNLILVRPDLLTSPDCPYPPDVTEFLAALLGAAGPVREVKSLSAPEDLERELSSLYADLQTLSSGLANVDAGEKIQWAKASVGLLERLVALRERVFNVKQISEFQRTVINCLDEVLEPAQRTLFTEKLGKFTISATKGTSE